MLARTVSNDLNSKGLADLDPFSRKRLVLAN